MIDITLRGILGKKFGASWSLDVESVFEIFDALQANIYKAQNYFKDIVSFTTHFIVFVDGKIMPSHLLNSKLLKNGSKVEIVPIVQGGWTIGAIIIGIVLITAAILIAKFLTPKAPKDVQTNSTILGGIRNVLNRNIAVPIGYGRLRIGSVVVSNDVSVAYVRPDDYKNIYRRIG